MKKGKTEGIKKKRKERIGDKGREGAGGRKRKMEAMTGMRSSDCSQ
jgi:hypothetical protein